MTDKTKSLLYTQKTTNFRYSQTSSDSTENSEIDYNLYCFSQGYKNREKGYWRGVLRNKYVDFDLRFNKEWNRRIEFEDDDINKTLQSFVKPSSNELISYVNDNEITWDSNGFQNFKNIQLKAGKNKAKNKEWLLSNGIRRNAGGVELKTQNYKQFEASEKNKEFKKAMLSQQGKQIEDKNGKNQYVGSKWTADKAQKNYKTTTDALTSSANVNQQKGQKAPTGSAYNLSVQDKRIDTNINLPKKNLVTEFNYDQYKKSKIDKSIAGTNIGKDKDKTYDKNKSRQGIQTKSQTQRTIDKYGKNTLNQGNNYNIPSTKGYVTGTGTEKPAGYGKNYSTQKDRQEFKYGQKGVHLDQKSNIYTQKTFDKSRPDFSKYYSVDKKKKEKKEAIERKPGERPDLGKSVDYKYESRNKTITDKKSKPYGLAPDYQQYYLSSKTTQQQPGTKTTSTYGKMGTYDTYGTYGTGSSKLNTAATMGKNKSHDRMNKSVDGKIDSISKDTFKKAGLYQSSTKQKPYGQPQPQPQTYTKTTSKIDDNKKIISSSQRYASAPKKPSPGTSKKMGSTSMQTPTQKQKGKLDQYKKTQYSQQNIFNKPDSSYQKTQKGADSIKLDLSKYYKKETPKSQKQKEGKDTKQKDTKTKQKQKKPTTEPEIYEYYPIGKSDSKADKYNKNKNTNKNLTHQFKYDDLYEYNPVTKIYEYKPDKIKKASTIDHKRGGALSTDSRYKKDYSSVANTKTTTDNKNVPPNRSLSINLDKYDTSKTREVRSPSFSFQRDRFISTNADPTKGKNNRYLLSPFSDQRSTLLNSSDNFRNSMAYFKFKFLTTKQVVEKFWKSIDTGELSSLMFDSNKVSARNSGTASKLSNFLSPVINRQGYKMSFSNENTEYTAKNYGNNGKNRGTIYSNSDQYFKNLGDVRTSL